MLETKAKPDTIDVSRLLVGAAKAMRSARYCWPRPRPVPRMSDLWGGC
jgi:hypothetical protein